MKRHQTTISHLKKFPEPYRSQALKNTRQKALYFREETAVEALLGAFDWAETEELGQGYKYWEEFSKTLEE